jgi:hypothetical protein
MPIMYRYLCKDHGEFDSFHADCPTGCGSKVTRVITAPNILHGNTKQADSTLKGLANDFKMTNLKSTREGESQEGYYTRNNAPQPQREPRPGDSAIWGGNGGFNMQQIMAGNAFRSVKGEPVGISPKEVGATRGPKTASYIADHENLKISK